MKKLFRLLVLVAVLVAGATYVLPKFNIESPVQVPDMNSITQSIGESVQDLLDTADDISSDATQVDADLYGPYDVVRVVDGDTAIINIGGEEKRVRFIGVDTPESVNPDESKNTEEGKIASQYTKDLLTGKQVYLEYDVGQEDKYGRTLAYIYLDDGETMVQDLLLQNGLATVMTIQPNSKYADHFYNLQVEARDNGVGFWEAEFFEG